MMPTCGTEVTPAALHAELFRRRPSSRWDSATIVRVLSAATALCLLNILKPVTIDDPAYLAYATHIAEYPLDPYGFTLFWYQHPQPAFDILSPPVFNYWLALGWRLVGDCPPLLKLWLWPWCVCLSAALSGLLQRFARPHAVPLLWMTVLSPAVLPALNLMLDVPCLALHLAAVTCFLHARDQSSWPLAVCAGILAGLAMQTKYTALVAPAVLLFASWAAAPARRKCSLRLGVMAAVTAVFLFSVWELCVASRYGESHFLAQLARQQAPWWKKVKLLNPWVGLLGGIGAPLGLLGLAAVRVSSRRVVVAGLAYVGGLGLMICIPASARSERLLESIVFDLTGFGTVVVLLLSAAALLKSRGACGGRADNLVLVGWWFIELAGSLLLSPWPAARRVIGIAVVGTILTGRLARYTCRSLARRRLVRGIALFGIALGLIIQAVDIDTASAERESVERVYEWMRAEDLNATVWFTGHWGLQYCALRTGWRPVEPDWSELMAGDWLVVPERDTGGQRIELPSQAVFVRRFDRPSRWPISTMPWFAGSNAAFRRQTGPVLSLDVYRITASCVPRAPECGLDEP
jgi:hypothetical protein